jgi:hypothetical protein
MTYSRLAFAAASLLLLAACHEQTTQVPATQPTTSTGPQCYAYTFAKDTVRLTLATTQPTVTGQLTYHYLAKDRNQGTIQGTMHGDTLLATYTFQSEGIQSVREVAFVRRGPGFVEGYGNIAEHNGQLIFERPLALQFDTKRVLAPVSCAR